MALIDWRRVGRRLSVVVLAWTALGLLGMGVTAALVGGVRASEARIWVGLAALGALASVIGIVAVSAFGGMLRAGERGERLAGDDVGLLPPRRRR